MRSAIALLSRAGPEGEGEAMVKPTPPSEHSVPVAISATFKMEALLPESCGCFPLVWAVLKSNTRGTANGRSFVRYRGSTHAQHCENAAAGTGRTIEEG